MTTSSGHIIRLIDTEITVSDKNSLSLDYAISLIKKAVEKVEASWNRKYNDRYYRIENLELELEIDAADITGLDTIISRELEKIIDEKIYREKKNGISFVGKEAHFANSQKSDAVGLTVQERKEELFLYFLKHGRFPWWAGKETISFTDNFLDKIPQRKWKALLHKILSIGPVTIKRLTQQLPEDLIQELIRKSVLRTDFPIEEIFKLIEKLTQSEKKLKKPILYELVLFSLTQGESEESLTRKLINYSNEFSNDIDIEPLKIKNFKNKKQDFKAEHKSVLNGDLSEDITVNNTGIVLLHPFLNALFTELRWVNENEFINDESKERAVCLLYYLTTGMEEFPENELIFFKFLCSHPLGLPVDRYLQLSDKEKEEAENVLKSAVKHWSVLKNTSVDGLRSSFLQRDGILKKTEFGYTLFVEHTTIDILLDKLPWNLSLVKLPWMDKILTVSWN